MAKRKRFRKNAFVPRRPVIKIDPCAAEKKKVKVAAAIVGQVLVHFGAGYGSQQLAEDTTKPLPDFQIFATPQDIASFTELLLTSVLKHTATLNWTTDGPGRDRVCSAAFNHGVLARKEVVANGDAALTFPVILSTLRTIQGLMCPLGAGGGSVCDF